MGEKFFSLSLEDQAAAYYNARKQLELNEFFLEKDIWIVFILEELFNSPSKDNFIFKGGTSLSKAYKAIERFSEDIDLTLDIRHLLSGEKKMNPEGLPPTKTQARNWINLVRKRLSSYISEQFIPMMREGFNSKGFDVDFRIDGAFDDNLFIRYPSLWAPHPQGTPEIKVDFSARSTGEPYEELPVNCYMSSKFPDLEFPNIICRVMKFERTFYEKLTAIHIFCKEGQKTKLERFSRHFYDIHELMCHSRIQASLTEKSWMQMVVDNKKSFYPMKNAQGEYINYEDCLKGGLCLIPEGPMFKSLFEDYNALLESKMIYGKTPTFQDILKNCEDVAKTINALFDGKP